MFLVSRVSVLLGPVSGVRKRLRYCGVQVILGGLAASVSILTHHATRALACKGIPGGALASSVWT